MDEQKTSKALIIKSIYFYLVSFVALMMVVFCTADIIKITLKTYVFTKADDYYRSNLVECSISGKYETPKGTPIQYSEEDCQKLEDQSRKRQQDSQTASNQSDLVRDISMVVVGIPLFLFHWGYIRKKKDEI